MSSKLNIFNNAYESIYKIFNVVFFLIVKTKLLTITFSKAKIHIIKFVNKSKTVLVTIYNTIYH